MIPKLVPFGVDGVAFGCYFGALLEVSGCPWALILGSGGTPGRVWRAAVAKDPCTLSRLPFFERFWNQNGPKKRAKMQPTINGKNDEFLNAFSDGLWVPK